MAKKPKQQEWLRLVSESTSRARETLERVEQMLTLAQEKMPEVPKAKQSRAASRGIDLEEAANRLEEAVFGDLIQALGGSDRVLAAFDAAAKGKSAGGSGSR